MKRISFQGVSKRFIFHFPMQNIESIDYQNFNLCAVQIGYAKRISIECKPLETNELSRKVHYSNKVIFLNISN